jgi:tetratricopeptide (TPR) repeat protein
MLYIEKIIYPTSMPIMLYDITPSLQTYATNIFVFLALFYIFYKHLISKKVLTFAILFSFLAILPTFALQDYLFLTHRLIVSVTGILIVLVCIIEFLIMKYPKLKKYFVIIFIFLFSLFSFCSFLQIEKYKDSFTYWRNAYNDSPNYHITCSGFAKECIYSGYYDKAIELLFEAKKLKNMYDYDLDICTALISAGKISEAKDRLLKLMAIKEDIITLIYLSEIYYIENNIEKAVEFAKKAYKQDKKNQFVLNHIQRLPNFDYNI